jgi:hypothetical protein
LFFVDDALALFAVYVTGQDAFHDLMAVQAGEDALSELVLESGGVSHPRLSGLSERPLVVLVPFGGCTEEERKIVRNLALGLAAAFFEKRVEEVAMQEDVFSVN